MHYGTDGGDETNPALLRHYLEEIRCCNQISKAGYFLVSHIISIDIYSYFFNHNLFIFTNHTHLLGENMYSEKK